MYKIYLNNNVSSNFRNVVNKYINFSINKTAIFDKKRDNAWNSICAIMDRIDDLVIYLNDKELNNGKWRRCAFDFFELIEQASVLIECIDEAYMIYGIEPSKSNKIFKNKKLNDDYIKNANNELKKLKLNDKCYFEYIRSLSSVHPSRTSHHRQFQLSDFEVSPFVVWKDGICNIDPRCTGEIVLVTYSNGSVSQLTNKSIYINEIFNFIRFKYYSLNNLSKNIEKQYKKQISYLRKLKLKKIDEFIDYNKYLDYLIEESKKRGCDLEENLEEVKKILNCKNIKGNNKKFYNKYCNALKFAIKIIRRQLQNLDYKCNSICDNLLLNLLLGKIYEEKKEGCSYSYYQEKICYLKDEYEENKEYAISCFKELMPVFKNYIDLSIDNLIEYSYNDLYILSQIATYFHGLENDEIINKIIPNNDDYR